MLGFVKDQQHLALAEIETQIAQNPVDSPHSDCPTALRYPVWSKISNALKRLGFRSHNFLAQLLSETARACTIRVRRSSLGRLWNDLGSHAGLHHRNRRPGTSTEKRISGRREPDPESPNPRPDVVIRCRKSYVGGDRPPARTESLGRIGGGRETGYAAGLVPKAHRQQIGRAHVSQIPGSSPS